MRVHILNRDRAVLDRRTGALIGYGRIGVGGVRLQTGDADTEGHGHLRIVIVPGAVELLVHKDPALGGRCDADLGRAGCGRPGQRHRDRQRADTWSQRPPKRPNHERTIPLDSGVTRHLSRWQASAELRVPSPKRPEAIH